VPLCRAYKKFPFSAPEETHYGKRGFIRGQRPISFLDRDHRCSSDSETQFRRCLQRFGHSVLNLSNYSKINMPPGELQSVDGYMNIALEKTEEYVNGRLRRSYGDAFVRGNNGNRFPTRSTHFLRSTNSVQFFISLLTNIYDLFAFWRTPSTQFSSTLMLSFGSYFVVQT